VQLMKGCSMASGNVLQVAQGSVGRVFPSTKSPGTVYFDLTTADGVCKMSTRSMTADQLQSIAGKFIPLTLSVAFRTYGDGNLGVECLTLQQTVPAK